MQNPIIYALVIKSPAVLRRGKEGHVYFYSSIHTKHTSKCLTKARKCYNITIDTGEDLTWGVWMHHAVQRTQKLQFGPSA